MAQIKKTDNHYIADKVYIRSNHLPPLPQVLDCFAGNGVIWKKVAQNNPGVEIKRLAIEKQKNKGGFHLAGDNVRFLKSLDLSVYNVIDLDAYGVPYEQVKILFDRGWHGLVFFTFIQSVMGNLPHDMLIEVGFSKAMITKAPTLSSRHGWKYFTQFLSLHGVNKVTYINHQRKYYGFFVI
jgi:hypothetical protein